MKEMNKETVEKIIFKYSKTSSFLCPWEDGGCEFCNLYSGNNCLWKLSHIEDREEAITLLVKKFPSLFINIE